MAIAAIVLLREKDSPFPRIFDVIIKHQKVFFIGAGMFMLALSYLLRVRASLLGDGFFLIKNFSDAFHGISPVWLIFNIFGHPATYPGFLTGYFFAELILEAGFLFMVIRTLQVLTDDPTARIAGFLSIIAMPTMQLFFGYIETYSVTLFTLSLYIYLAAMTLRRRIPFWILPVVFLFLFLTHYMNSLLIFSLFYVAYREIRARGWRDVAVGFGVALVIFLFILTAIGFDIDPYTTTVPHHHYLPLSPSTDPADAITEAYTLLSPYHLSDLLNYLILMGLPLVLVIPFVRQRKDKQTFLGQEMSLFFLISFIPLLSGLLVLKFDLGAVRDWDVFAGYFYMIPLFLTVRTVEFAELRITRSVFFIIFVLLLHSAAYWFTNASADATVARISTIFDKRTLSHGAYYTASLNLGQYYHQIHEDEKAIAVWNKFQSVYPGDTRGYENLIFNYQKLTPVREDNIENVYNEWMRAIPDDTTARQLYRNYCVDRGNNLFRDAHFTDAALYYKKALSVDSTYASALNNLGGVYAQEGDNKLAEKYFRLALSRNSSYGEAMFNLGTILAEEEKIGEAKEYFRQAAALHIEGASRSLDSLERNTKARSRKP